MLCYHIHLVASVTVACTPSRKMHVALLAGARVLIELRQTVAICFSDSDINHAVLLNLKMASSTYIHASIGRFVLQWDHILDESLVFV